MSTWMDTSGLGLETPPGIEDDNAGKISFAAVQNNDGFFVAVIYDAKSPPGGGVRSANVEVTCDGLSCPTTEFVVSDVPDTIPANPFSLVWTNTRENGYVVGPIASGGERCFIHSSLNGVSEARFVDGADSDFFLGFDATAEAICIGFNL